jgi:hypothetical protein
MALRKMEKMIDVAGEDSNPNADILSDTTPRFANTIKTWTQFFDILECEIINCLEDSIEKYNDSYVAKLIHIA